MNEPHLLWAMCLLGALLATTLGIAFYELLKQQGRVLLRLHEINLRLSALGAPAASLVSMEDVGEKPLASTPPLQRSRIERNGLRAGTPAPDFSLPDLHGEMISLHDYRGRRVLLIFTDPNCGPCDKLILRLACSPSAAREAGLELLIVGRGDPEQNRVKTDALAVVFPVVLQKKWELSRKYGIFATPVGFLIGPNGLIERDVARGAEEIVALTH